MDQNNPFEDIFHQINELLQVIADNADKPLNQELPMDIEAKIGKLEREVDEFKKAGRAYIAQLGVTDQDMKAYLEKAGQSAGKSSKKIFERTESLKKEIEKKKEALEKLAKQDVRAESEDISLSEKKHLEKKSPAARKSLFKRVGGNKNWRPL